MHRNIGIHLFCCSFWLYFYFRNEMCPGQEFDYEKRNKVISKEIEIEWSQEKHASIGVFSVRRLTWPQHIIRKPFSILYMQAKPLHTHSHPPTPLLQFDFGHGKSEHNATNAQRMVLSFHSLRLILVWIEANAFVWIINKQSIYLSSGAFYYAIRTTKLL